MRTSRGGVALAACLVVASVGLLTGCGSEEPEPRGERGEGVEEALELPTEPAFAPGPRRFPTPAEERIWAEGSVLHLGDRTYDLAPTVVDGFVPTPYGVFVRYVVGSGIDAVTEVGYFDGHGPLQELPHGVHDVTVSDSGEHVGWIFAGGPEVESHAEGARASVAVLVETATGAVVHQSTEALLQGADYPDEYTPEAHGFLGERFYWGDAYSGQAASVDAQTLEEEATTEGEIEEAFAGPGRGAYDVEAHYEELVYGAVRITDSRGRPVDTGYRSTTPLGTVGPPAGDRVLLLGQQARPEDLSDESAPPGGAILECALGSGECTVVATVAEADQVRGAAHILW